MDFLTAAEAQAKLRALNPSRPYWVMYSTIFGGFVRDPEVMVIPLDDHMVHRGDGIFEALRFQRGKLCEFDAHLTRLFESAEMIGLKVPLSRAELENICRQAVAASPETTGMMRVFVSRGFGDFSPNPYSTRGAHVFVLTMPFAPPPAEKYQKGASVVFSSVTVKPDFFARVKSCNYLPNVLMKKEAVDRGVDFAVAVTSAGEISEGPTENILVLTGERDLLAPPFTYTLRGTTLLRVMELARARRAEFNLRRVECAPLTKADLHQASEIMMVGTTLGVLPVTMIENQPVGDGQVGPVARALHAELVRAWEA